MIFVHGRRQFRILAFIVPVHDAGYILFSGSYGIWIVIGLDPDPAVSASDM
jgi:hypothetical protein